MPDDRTTRASTDAKRIDNLVAWARSRIAQCRRDEEKFFSLRAAQERQTLQAVLKILGREP